MANAIYDNDNIFAKILRKEIPCHKIHEDDHTLCFMDIMPRTDGHCLVIPKQPIRNIFDANDEALGHVYAAARLLSIAATTVFKADGVTIQQFNEPAGGQEVFHLHMHVLPRHDGKPLGPHTGELAEDGLLAIHAAEMAAQVLKLRNS